MRVSTPEERLSQPVNKVQGRRKSQASYCEERAKQVERERYP